MESILYFLLWAGLFFVMMRFGCGAHVMGHGDHHHGSSSTGPASQSPSSDPARHWIPPEKDVDPVCHMRVETAKAKTAVYKGRLYHFCSQDCRSKFEGDPKAFLPSASDAAAI